MIRAEPNGARERGERYLLGDMFFDVAAHGPLLPGGETAARRWLDAAHASAAAHELMRQHDAERLAVMPIFTAVLDQPAQFDRGFPQRLVFEEQAWRQKRVLRDCPLSSPEREYRSLDRNAVCGTNATSRSKRALSSKRGCGAELVWSE